MILPTVTFDDDYSLRASPTHFGKLVWLWVRYWQTILHVTLKAACSESLRLSYGASEALLSRWWFETRQWKITSLTALQLPPHLFWPWNWNNNNVLCHCPVLLPASFVLQAIKPITEGKNYAQTTINYRSAMLFPITQISSLICIRSAFVLCILHLTGKSSTTGGGIESIV